MVSGADCRHISFHRSPPVMPIAFSTSLRALAAEQDRGRIAGLALALALALALVLVAAWAVWLFGAPRASARRGGRHGRGER